MSLDTSITEILTMDLPAAFERFGEILDPQWVEEALQQTGTATIRRRKLGLGHANGQRQGDEGLLIL